MLTLQLDYNLKGDLQKIYPAVLDMRSFGHHHPYMKEVKLVHNNGEFIEYKVKEMVWIFGFIPQWPSYNARVFEKEKERHIQYTSQVKAGLDLKIDFLFSQTSDNTIGLSEKIELEGSKMVCKVLMNTIHKAHGILFRNLETDLLRRNSLPQNKS